MEKSVYRDKFINNDVGKEEMLVSNEIDNEETDMEIDTFLKRNGYICC